MSDRTVKIAWVDRDGYARTAVVDADNMDEEVKGIEDCGYEWTVVGPVLRKLSSQDTINLKVEEEGSVT